MKLIKCHIINFGVLSNLDIKFNDGLNAYINNNGSGKSTLAIFLKAMLYGMDSYSSRTLLSERKHFTPLSGGLYGGSLTINYKNNEYTIYKEFDKKSETKDIIKVTNIYGDNINTIDNNIISNNIGEILLGINKDAFSRCNFIYSNDLDFKINDSIKMKLNNIIIDYNKEYSYDEIIDRINLDLKSNKEGSKNYGTTYSDKIKIAKKENEELRNNINIINNMNNELIDLYDKYNNINNRLNEIKNEKEELRLRLVEKENWDNLNRMIDNLNSDKSELDSILSNYSKGIITKEDLELLENLKNDIINIDNDINDISTKLDNNFIVDYNNRYQNDVIDNKLYDNLYNKYLEINNIANSKNNIIKPDNNRLIYLAKRFMDDSISLDEVNNTYNDYNYNKIKLNNLINENEKKIYPNNDEVLLASNYVNDYNDKNNELNKLNNYKSLKGFIKILVIIFTLGIYLIIENNNIKKINNKKKLLTDDINNISLELDNIFNKFNITDGNYDIKLNSLITLKNMKQYDNIDSEINRLKEDISNKENRLNSVFNKCGYNSDLTSNYNSFSCDYKEYIKLKEDNDKYNIEIKNIDSDINNKNNIINSILDKYYSNNCSIKEKLETLRSDINKKSKYDEYNNKLNSIKDKRIILDNNIKEILDKYNINYDNNIDIIYKKLFSDFNRYNSLSDSISKRDSEINKFKIEKNLVEYIDIDIDSEVSRLDIEEGSCKELAKSYDNRIKEIENNVGLIDEYNERIEVNDKIIDECNYNLDIINKAMGFINSAETKLEEKYLNPIKDRFINYTNLIKKELGFNTKMNFDYNIVKDVNGQVIPCSYLSDGEKSIIMLALRFAVIDNLYKDNDTFVILDDSLVYLDDINISKAKNVILDLAKDKQIIYFTCHNSRGFD